MIYYILSPLIGLVIGFLIGWFVMTLLFMKGVESGSINCEPINIFGKQYFFMTQDQIQNAVRAIIGLEQEYDKPQSEIEIN